MKSSNPHDHEPLRDDSVWTRGPFYSRSNRPLARLVARRMATASDSMLAGLAAHLTTGGTSVA